MAGKIEASKPLSAKTGAKERKKKVVSLPEAGRMIARM